MGVKTYQAFSMAEALDAAKRDLGADAVVLETRTFKRGGILGLGKRDVFELTATTADRVELSGAQRRVSRQRTPASSSRTPTVAPPRGEAVAARAAYARNVEEPSVPDTTRTRRLAQALAETHERRQREGAAAPARRTAEAVAVAPPPTESPVQRRSRPGGVARRFILTAARGSPGSAPRRLDVADPAPAAADAHHVAPAVATDMQVELAAIKAMVGQVLHRQPGVRGPDPASMPARLFGMYLELVGQDLSDELAERIVTAVREELDPSSWEDETVVRAAVLDRLTEFVPAADAIVPRRSPDDRPLTIALIGPTGVGKTTTLAKLAAAFKLREGRRVGLVTCDTYRIAAVDQLRTYANIMGLELKVALTPVETRRAVGSLRDRDVILIDTAGRGSNDTGRIDELLQCLRAADPHEVHLVLSSTASEKVLLREAEAFTRAGANRIVLTKLDEAVSFGVLINVMQKIGKKLSFITTGQEVPDHIEPGEPRRLAQLVLGAEIHS
ncbi:MAG: flagellar biosynthesis protein FlhF [Planctomycetota bacterium]|jgi:flagellar biosynthesis protein FlhF